MLTRKALIEKSRGEGVLPHLFPFFGHRPEHPGVIGDECLSQWYPAEIKYAGCVFPTNEHWMMMCKARHFGDQEATLAIMTAPSPKQAKWVGRRVKNRQGERWTQQDIDEWAEAALGYVMMGNILKFSQHPELNEVLQQTGDRVIVEASQFDVVWGCGMWANDPGFEDPENWPGENRLGFVLMEVRALLSHRYVKMMDDLKARIINIITKEPGDEDPELQKLFDRLQIKLSELGDVDEE